MPFGDSALVSMGNRLDVAVGKVRSALEVEVHAIRPMCRSHFCYGRYLINSPFMPTLVWLLTESGYCQLGKLVCLLTQDLYLWWMFSDEH